MYLHTQQFINEIAVDEPDPAAANALQEGLGGQFGEMRTMMQYLFQSMNFRGDATSKPYKDLLQSVAILGAGEFGAVLERVLDLGQRLRVDQFTQLLLAEQLAQEVAVERQRLRARSESTRLNSSHTATSRMPSSA